jgi:hypothetical protein
MLRDLFKSLGGVEQYGMISMVIFLAFFILLVINTVHLKAKDVDEYSRMPLDDFSKDSDEIHDN